MSSISQRRLAALVVTTALVVSTAAFAGLKGVGTPEVAFQAVGPAGLKIKGSSNSLAVKESEGRLVFVAGMGHFETGIGLRDRHLRNYLDVKSYPTATLTVARSSLKLPEDGKSTRGNATGQLTLHGVKKPFPFSYLIERTGAAYAAQGLGSVDIRDHEIEVPCYLGVCVEPVVKLKVKFRLKEEG